jgi:hydroxymethylglutaryl-CoA lyase/(R)-citramalyl-CoA lyase
VSAEVSICEVGPRDGLQNDAVVLEPPVRAELVDRLAAAGLPRIEAVSFVNPARVPAMAGAEEVIAGLGETARARVSALVLNRRGFDRALETGVPEIHYAFVASQTFNRRNANATVEEGLATGLEIVGAARDAGLRVTVGISAAFGCPYEGLVDPGAVLDLAARIAASQPDEIVLADTIGAGTPGQVARLVTGVLRVHPRVGVHLHNTRGSGIANAWAALEAGATSFDASLGGIGGCPFAPNATGNIATEDLVYLLEGEGVETGVDLPALIEVTAWLEGLLGRSFPGNVHRAGPFPPVPVSAT